jgi:NAD(P)-dependent dehydrogenase (short-subunit alcohol dehydrogenase family)
MTDMKALVIGASGGIGKAVAAGLAPVATVTTLSRRDDGLDVRSQASVDAALGALPGPYDLIFVATGALVVDGQRPEKALKEVSETSLRDQWEVNALGPALILRHAPRLLPRDRRAVWAAGMAIVRPRRR